MTNHLIDPELKRIDTDHRQCFLLAVERMGCDTCVVLDAVGTTVRLEAPPLPLSARPFQCAACACSCLPCVASLRQEPQAARQPGQCAFTEQIGARHICHETRSGPAC